MLCKAYEETPKRQKNNYEIRMNMNLSLLKVSYIRTEKFLKFVNVYKPESYSAAPVLC